MFFLPKSKIVVRLWCSAVTSTAPRRQSTFWRSHVSARRPRMNGIITSSMSSVWAYHQMTARSTVLAAPRTTSTSTRLVARKISTRYAMHVTFFFSSSWSQTLHFMFGCYPMHKCTHRFSECILIWGLFSKCLSLMSWSVYSSRQPGSGFEASQTGCNYVHAPLGACVFSSDLWMV